MKKLKKFYSFTPYTAVVRRRHAPLKDPAELRRKADLRLYGQLWGVSDTPTRAERARVDRARRRGPAPFGF